MVHLVKKKTIYSQVRQLTPRNIASFRNLLIMADYSTVLTTADVNEADDHFIIIYKSLFEISYSVKLMKVKKKNTLNENHGLLRAY